MIKKVIIKNNYYIITGGPGVGKTTLIQELEKAGYTCIPEVAREIIKHQVETNGNALPWEDTKKYSQLMLEYSIRDFEKYIGMENICFFDRGIPDTLGYETLMNFPFNKELTDAVNDYRYNRTVFLLPFWKEIYETDKERKQDLREAEETYRVMKKTYESLSYDVVEVPLTSPAERAAFVINRMVSEGKRDTI